MRSAPQENKKIYKKMCRTIQFEILTVNEKGMKGKMKVEKFWEYLGQLLKKYENVRSVFLFGDMNARVGSTEIGGVVGMYGVDGVNKNGQYLADICSGRSSSR